MRKSLKRARSINTSQALRLLMALGQSHGHRHKKCKHHSHRPRRRQDRRAATSQAQQLTSPVSCSPMPSLLVSTIVNATIESLETGKLSPPPKTIPQRPTGPQRGTKNHGRAILTWRNSCLRLVKHRIDERTFVL